MTKEIDSPKQQPIMGSGTRNFDQLKLELNNINQGIHSYILERRVSGTWGESRYGIGDEVDQKTDEASRLGFATENFSVHKYLDDDADDSPSLYQCPTCDFEIDLQSVHDPKNMLCPVCDEELGEDAIRAAQQSLFDPFLSSFVYDESIPMPSPDLSLLNEDISNHASDSDIFNAKSSGTNTGPNMDNEQDNEEKRLKASFVQELVLSILL
ncbi:hypothetical protein RJT34_13026 [Clitoria ternatea]|uniref:Di19 C-terminal domain-containing protein n=1 Tax=Clitoria ternatea TaxID=43366 RepID=A0AAN9JMT6_CLITE